MVENQYSVEYYEDLTVLDPLKRIKARHFHSSQLNEGVTEQDYIIRYLNLTDELTYKIVNNDENPNLYDNNLRIAPFITTNQLNVDFKDEEGNKILTANKIFTLYNTFMLEIGVQINTTPLRDLPADEVMSAEIPVFNDDVYSRPEINSSKSKWFFDPVTKVEYNSVSSFNVDNNPCIFSIKLDEKILSNIPFLFNQYWIDTHYIPKRFVDVRGDE